MILIELFRFTEKRLCFLEAVFEIGLGMLAKGVKKVGEFSGNILESVDNF